MTSGMADAAGLDGCELDSCPFLLLPPALFAKVLLLLPVDARAVCAAVCKGWHNTLADRALWARLDLKADCCGMACARVTDALLRGAAAKARGGLTALDVTGCKHSDARRPAGSCQSQLGRADAAAPQVLYASRHA